MRKDHISLFKDSSLLVTAGLVNSVLYALVHLMLLRLMDPVSYAMFASLMALLKIMNVPSMALLTSIARYTSQFVHENETAFWVTIVKRAMRKLLILGVVALVVWTMSAGLIKDLMQVPSSLNILMLGIVAFLGLFAPVVDGTLQGARRFGWLAVSSIGNSCSRALFCGLALLVFGSQVSPMLAAVAGGTIIGLLLGLWPFRLVMTSVKAIDGYDTKPVYAYFWPVLIGQGAVFLITELDLVLAPRFLDGDELGAYTAAAMLTRMIFLLTQPFATALFPRAVVADKRLMMMKIIGVSLGVSILGAVFVCMFPGIPMWLMKRSAAEAVHVDLLKRYIWAALPFSIISVMTPYLWARNRLRAVLALLPVAALYVLLRIKFSGSPTEMIACLAGILWLSAMVLGVSMIREIRPRDDEETGNA